MQLAASAVLAAIATSVVFTAGCDRARPATDASRQVVVTRSLAPGDVRQSDTVVRAGHLLVRVFSAQCGIDGVTGTHAEFLPKRPLCRLALRVTDDDAAYHSFTTSEQKLVMADRSLVDVSVDAMHVRRQPVTTELGSRNSLELELWYEPPTGGAVVALRVQGDADPDPGGMTVKGAAPRVALLRLRGLRT